MKRKYKVFLSLLSLLATLSLLLAWKDHKPKIKTQEDYWAQVELNDAMLRGLFKGDKCLQNLNKKLACLNSINQAALKVGMTLDANLGLRELKASDEGLTEKKFIESWITKIEKSSEFPDLLSNWEIIYNKDLQSSALEKNAGQQNMRISAAINGYFSIVQDPHSYLIPLEYYTKVLAATENQSQSFGFTIKKTQNGIRIQKVIHDSSAAKAGLKRFDIITGISGQKIANLTIKAIQDLLRTASLQSAMQITIARGGREVEYTLQKQNWVAKAIEGRMIDREKGIGLMTINKFSVGLCKTAKALISDLNKNGLKKLILDLRDNSGGVIEEAACLLSAFVPKGQKLFELQYLDTRIGAEVFTARGELLFAGSLGVLINAGTASSAELVAGALKEIKGAVILGQTSFGKGSFQQGEVWDKNEKIAIFKTKGFFYLPSGNSPQLVGIEPDIRLGGFDDPWTLREKDLYFAPLEAPQLTASENMQMSLFETGLTAAKIAACDAKPELFSVNSLDGEDNEIQEAGRYLDCTRRSVGAEYDTHRSF